MRNIATRGSGIMKTAGGATVFAWAMLWASPAALGQGAGQPPGIQVWNSDIHDSEFGAPGGEAPAIAIVCPRNGAASGKVIVAAGSPLQGLKATMSDLRQGQAAIPSSRIAVRYAVEWDGGIAYAWAGIPGADVLLESPLPTFPALQARRAAVRAAVPVWLTVRVPKDARPGAYSGRLTVQAAGGPPVSVPVKLDVPDWTLPDSQDYRTWIDVIEQPDTLAEEYKVPPWSDRHWEMIGKSLELIAATGSRVVNVPLICRTNYGNDQSMVRWIRKPDGTYDYDFSIMEKYLDLVQQRMGKPKLVLFNVWEVYLTLTRQTTTVPVKGPENSYEWREATRANMLLERKGKGPVVTVLDPAANKTEQFTLPRYEDPASQALWRPLWEGIRSRMKARGLEGAMMLAQISDLWPTKGEVEFWNDLTGGLTWASCSHHANWVPYRGVSKPQLPGGGMIGYTAVCFDYELVLNPLKDRRYGWKTPILHAEYCRFQHFNTSSLPTIRHEAEINITGAQRGVGHIGGDFWPCFKDKAGRRIGTVTDRYPESYWHSLNIGGYLLAPGPTGPVGTARMEVFREGVQDCEARIAIEAALTDAALKAKLGDDLAKRAQDTLDERHLAMWRARGATDEDFQKYGLIRLSSTLNAPDFNKKWEPTRASGLKWYLASWPERTAKLFTIAGEVDKKLAAK